jgi:hypothetical protein
MKILVTGATGFIGAAIAPKAVAATARDPGLVAVRLRGREAAIRRFDPRLRRLADPVSLAAPAAQVDAIVSTASIGQVESTPDSFAKDRDTVAVITKALGDSGKRSSSPAVRPSSGFFTKGEASPTIFDEDHPVPLPASVFASPEVEIPAPFIDAFGGAMVRRVETEKACRRKGHAAQGPLIGRTSPMFPCWAAGGMLARQRELTAPRASRRGNRIEALSCCNARLVAIDPPSAALVA